MTQPTMTKAKAWVAALGTSLTAAATALATVQLVLSDDAVDLTEYSTLLTAAVTLAATVYGVWRTPNKVISTRARTGDPTYPDNY